MPAGSSETVRVTSQYNVSADIRTGILTVSVLVDPHDYIPEDNETNNLLVEDLYVVYHDHPEPEPDDEEFKVAGMNGYIVMGALWIALVFLCFYYVWNRKRNFMSKELPTEDDSIVPKAETDSDAKPESAAHGDETESKDDKAGIRDME